MFICIYLTQLAERIILGKLVEFNFNSKEVFVYLPYYALQVLIKYVYYLHFVFLL